MAERLAVYLCTFEVCLAVKMSPSLRCVVRFVRTSGRHSFGDMTDDACLAKIVLRGSGRSLGYGKKGSIAGVTTRSLKLETFVLEGPGPTRLSD